MSKIINAGRSLLELVLILAISLVPVGSGLLVMLFQQDRKLEENSRVSVQEAIFSIDRALERIHTAASVALPLAGTPCEQARSRLLDLIQDAHYLRALALTRNGETYCDTLHPPQSQDALFANSDSQVRLAIDSDTAPNSTLVAYRLIQGNVGVIVSAYGFELRNELRAFQDGLTLLLEFGDDYIWAHGDGRDPARPSHSEFYQTGVSTNYGYTVHAGYAKGYAAKEARQSMMQIIPSLALVGIVTGSIAYWGLFRHRAKHSRTAVNRL
ncbi:CSS-motif domain-containing protein [Pseudomonas putida]